MREFITKQLVLSLILSLCAAIAVAQQRRTVTGVVRDQGYQHAGAVQHFG
jgi:hypothetical protein